jgi:hypothetical protein
MERKCGNVSEYDVGARGIVEGNGWMSMNDDDDDDGMT